MATTTTKAVRVHEVGGPEVLRYEDVSLGEPGAGQALILHRAVGLNFIDVYFRTGLYAGPPAPFVLGMEGAGVIEALGEGVTDLAVGDRVAYAGVMGAYAERRLIPAERLVKIPEGVADDQAAAAMLKGMTAHYLVRPIGQLGPGSKVLIHAAAGGVGLIACQWAKHLGASVWGTVSSDEKADLAAKNGCDRPIVTTRENFLEVVLKDTHGKGVDVVFDSVGKDTFMTSLDALRPRGMMASFGQSSGKIPPIDVTILSAKGSLFLTRPTLMTYTATRADLLLSANELFEVMAKGAVKITVGQRYALADVAEAHADLEGRKTVGSTVLLP